MNLMGKYPQMISDIFHEYLESPIIFLAISLLSIILIYKIFEPVKNVVHSEQKKLRSLLSFIEFFGVCLVLAVSLYVSGISKEIRIIIPASILIGIVYTYRSFIINVFYGFLLRRKKTIKEGDFISIDEQNGKIVRMSQVFLVLQLSSGQSVTIPYAKLLTLGFKNFDDEPLTKVSVSFAIDKYIQEETINEAIKTALQQEQYIDKFEYPEKKFSGGSSEQVVEINLWTYSDFYWDVHNKILPKIRTEIGNLALLKENQLKIAR